MNTVVVLAAVTAVLLATVVVGCIIHHVKVKKLNYQLEQWQLLASEYKMRAGMDSDAGKLIHVQYVASEADFAKYKTEKALNGGVRSKLLMNIVNAIFKAFGDPERKGNQYDYCFRIQKEEVR